MTQAALMRLWFQALGSELGILLQAQDPSQARSRLYSARACSLDAADLLDFTIRVVNFPDGNLMLAKKPKINPENLDV